MRGKPFPDLFLKALNILGIEGKDAVIFEDSIAGIKAAESANAGKVVIVDSNSGDYKAWADKYPIIINFNKIGLDWF
jgi:beta-phosphoglucomutase-like phosphatase (HAD superfamily)